MDSVHAISSANNASSFTTGGNLWRCERSTKNICYTSCCDSKAFPYKRKSQIEYNPLMFEQSRLNNHYKWIRNEECNKKYVGKAISRPYSEPEDSNTKNILVSIKEFMVAFYLFCYPYTVIGRTLSTVSASLFVVANLSDISPLFFIGLLQALVPHLFMDIYVNGVNQLFDLEIDKINKPYLPLASGQISYTTGVIIVASSLTLSFGLAWTIGSWPLIWSVVSCFLLWTAYSINVPLLRWKGHPLLAAMVIFATWAVIFPITFFAHMQTFVLKRAIIFPRSMIFSVVFLGFYSLGIALFKDIPDIDGDQTFGIQSFSARLGQKRVFWICVSLFEMAFGVAVVAGLTSSSPLVKIVTSLGHAVLGSILWYQAKSVVLSSKASIGSFYMLIWKLLYVAYFLMPLIR
ncbi:glycinol 4-dimethylallyltransferase-like [Vigna radiata var. radiata]|uniref:Glycinol 4-dimethylallyltransferase-like n=1 Tax=Vigna radiata var. radiata TaxID=3916 RepID=A0A3Q0FB29_VIGRR|nr:glycinol 4-dimethylallyltransferase-like [Vigna radiata var. radiata]